MSEESPSPRRYLEHAVVVNEAAGRALRLETRDASALQAKVSIGLSLQAAELAGKCFLRMMGDSSETIRRNYRGHNTTKLLKDVADRIEAHENDMFRLHGRYWRWQLLVDGVEYGTTIGEYFEHHFARGPSGYPRNYFYPDEETFAGPQPIQSLYVMVEKILDCTRRTMEAVIE
ncbi:hypothetical protein [Algiphilus sp.]|uniref:hypothetical protein n=1 Tax=Algiphilus sp. TaxID=1872431 RepID=UPI003B529D0F